MSIVRNESAHSINGVNGRIHNVVTWSESGLIANQKWVSERRSIPGYGQGATLQVEMRFDDNCRNGHSTFAITAAVRVPRKSDIVAGGCRHHDIAQVFPELAPLIKWHLVSTDGPIHYIANTLYHADGHGATHAWVYYRGPGVTDPLGLYQDNEKERLLGYLDAKKASTAVDQPGYRVVWDDKTAKTRNLDHARSSACWPEATDEELCAPRAELQTKLEARLPALLAAFRADMDACGFLWSTQGA